MFKFRLVGRNGEKIERETFTSAVPSWSVGERLFINPQLRYRVVDIREGDDLIQAVLVVERE